MMSSQWEVLCDRKLGTNGMRCFFTVDVLDIEPLNSLKLILVLANASKSDALAVVKFAVGNADVCTVRLQRDTVIAVIHSPVIEFYMRGPDSVGAVGVG